MLTANSFYGKDAHVPVVAGTKNCLYGVLMLITMAGMSTPWLRFVYIGPPSVFRRGGAFPVATLPNHPAMESTAPSP